VVKLELEEVDAETRRVHVCTLVIAGRILEEDGLTRSTPYLKPIDLIHNLNTIRVRIFHKGTAVKRRLDRK